MTEEGTYHMKHIINKLKIDVYKANVALKESGLVLFTWGNVSGITKDRKYVVIKPSGVPYNKISPKDMVVIDLNGKVLEGDLNPSSDTPTHLELYRNFTNINSIVHTHSTNATSFAQAKIPIKALGTTHADYFYGEIPVTRDLTKEEITSDYELNTGKVIVETFTNFSPDQVPACLVASHGVFAWGKSCENAVHNAIIVEEIAKMKIYSLMINADINQISNVLLNKHYLRKHGKNSYYGQK